MSGDPTVVAQDAGGSIEPSRPDADAGAASSDTRSPDALTDDTRADDAASAPDFGPMEDVVTGGEGPSVDPGVPGPVGCSADTAMLSKLSFTFVSGTPKAFVDAWNAEASKLSQGPLLLELRGLTGLSNKVQLAVGAPKGTGPIAFDDAPPPAVLGSLVFDPATRTISGTRQDKATMLFGARVTIGSIGFRGTLDAKCASVSGVKLTLLIPLSAGSTSFGGSTIVELLGPTNDVISPSDAWRVELTGGAS